MSCLDLLTLSQLHDGELGAPDAARARVHLAGCPVCRGHEGHIVRVGAIVARANGGAPGP